MDAFGQLKEIVKSLGLKCEQITVNGGEKDGFSVILKNPTDAIEIQRRCRATGIDVVFSPHPETDDQAVVYVRD